LTTQEGSQNLARKSMELHPGDRFNNEDTNRVDIDLGEE
jgi:hypothetical protein